MRFRKLMIVYFQGGMFVRAGMYSVFLKDWLSVYRRKSFHIIRAEDYFSNRSKTLTDAFQFLGLETMREEKLRTIQSARPKHASAWSCPQMYEHTREILQSFYEPFNRELADILGDPRFLWQD